MTATMGTPNEDSMNDCDMTLLGIIAGSLVVPVLVLIFEWLNGRYGWL